LGIAAFTRVCAYDRAGIGGSDRGPEPRTGRRIVEELHTLLQRAQVEPPYILAGLSFGGHYLRLFASLYPDEVAGLVFVDCSHEEMGNRFPAAMRRLFPLAKYVVGASTLLARIGVMRLLRARAPLVSQILAETSLPEAQRREILEHFAGTAQWEGMYAEAKVYPQTEAEVRAMRQQVPHFGDLPVTVLTAAGTWRDARQLPPGVKAEEVVPIWLELQGDLASLSSNSSHRVFDQFTHTGLLSPEGAGHVVGAVRQMVEEVRAKGTTI
jgi:pimeloyl-ACP methyl ester carboxylesterase